MPLARVLALTAALFFAGWGTACSDRDQAQTAPETDDPYYVQGVQLKRQGRNPEALTSFLRVIDRRGERGAPESHLQAGEIYLNQIKQPVYAYYHFSRYLELQPNSPQAELVRGMVRASLREFAKQLPGRPMEEQTVRMQAEAENAKLRRDIEELRAELAVYRGGGATPVKSSPRLITGPLESRATSQPVPTVPVTDPPVATPAPRAAASTQAPSIAGPIITPAGPTRAAPPVRPTPAAAAGRTHTVRPKETLYAISRQYNVKLEDLTAANGIRNPSAVPAGTVLKIPAASPPR